MTEADRNPEQPATNLIDRHGRWTGTDVRWSVRRYGRQDVSHAIRWGLRGWNPFDKGPLK
jgi:hypothetical protein